MKPNPGHCPNEAHGKNVRVVFEKDRETMRLASPPAGWPADGRFGLTWSLDRGDFTIAFYEVI